MPHLVEQIYLSEQADHNVKPINYNDSRINGLLYIATDADDEAFIAVKFSADIDIHAARGEKVGGYLFAEPEAWVSNVTSLSLTVAETHDVDDGDITDEVLQKIREIVVDFIYQQDIDAPDAYAHYPAFW